MTLLAIVVGVVPLSIDARQQDVVRIDGATRCASSCGIDTVRIATLKAPVDADAITYSSLLARDRRGRYAVSGFSSTLLAFNGDGSFLRQVARAGTGPGELQGIIGLAFGLGDSLLVFQNRYRMTVYDQGLRFVRDVRLPANLIGPTVTREGMILASAGFPFGSEWSGYAGYLFHGPSLTPQPIGRRVDLAANSTCGGCLAATVFSSPRRDHVWIAPSNRYVIDLVSIQSGAVLRRIAVSAADWFVEWMQGVDHMDGLHPKQSTITSVREDNAGMLWVMGTSTPREWKPSEQPLLRGLSMSGSGLSVQSKSGGEVVAQARHVLDQRFLTIVQVLDIENREIVGTLRLQGDFKSLGGTSMYRLRETADALVMDVYDLRLNRRPR